MGRVIVVACGVLLLLGLAMVVRWGGLAVVPPEAPTPIEGGVGSRWERVRRALWWLDLGLLTVIPGGLIVAGAGGRLMMRLLAVTAGPAAQGRLTEAEEVVGEITLGGTLGFFVFVGLAGGCLAAGTFLLLRRWLPRGRWGGLVVGLLLLVVAATRIEPLRPDNPDFAIVGPDWLAVAGFVALCLVQGLVTAAIAGRLSRSLPLLTPRPVAVLVYLPVLLFLLPPLLLPVGVAAVVGALLATPASPLRRAWDSALTATVGRVAVAAVALVALPGTVLALRDLLAG